MPCSAKTRLIVSPVPTGTVDFITSAWWSDARHRLDDGVDGGQVRVARVGGRRADGDEQQPRVLQRVRQIGGEVQPVAMLLDELGQPRLPDRHHALLEALDLGRVDVDAVDVVAEFGEPRRGDQADVSRADHADRLSIRGHEGGSGYRGALPITRA